jgi:hypothetical protein
MDGRSKGKKTSRQPKRAVHMQAMIDHLAINEAEQLRTEAVQSARAIALAGLPKRRTTRRELSRTLRLGQDLWLRVTYLTLQDNELPYGADRFVLAGIQHLALDRRSPVVFFEEVSELLKMFNLSTDGRSLELFRDRFRRLAGVAICLRFAETKENLDRAPAGESSFIIQKYLLPTRRELLCARIGQLSLPFLVPDQGRVRYGVMLSPYFWDHLKEPKNQCILPLHLMREFVDRPTGWDYASFLVDRCFRAKSTSVIDHDVLISLFRDSERENDKRVIRRLLEYHQEIMRATRGHLNAVLEQDGYFPSSGGRPKERWVLRVGPSKQIIWSGKQQNIFSPPASQS